MTKTDLKKNRKKLKSKVITKQEYLEILRQKYSQISFWFFGFIILINLMYYFILILAK